MKDDKITIKFSGALQDYATITIESNKSDEGEMVIEGDITKGFIRDIFCLKFEPVWFKTKSAEIYYLKYSNALEARLKQDYRNKPAQIISANKNK
jgi:hypothetical protein